MSRDYCPFCQTWSPGGAPCKITTCLGCGARQCMSHGLRSGTCGICYYGHLEGWSWGLNGRPKCGCAKCANPAVFVGVPRVNACCADCVHRVKISKTETLRDLLGSSRVAQRRRALSRDTPPQRSEEGLPCEADALAHPPLNPAPRKEEP